MRRMIKEKVKNVAGVVDSHLDTKYRIGMRVIKTVASVMICLLISLLTGNFEAISIMTVSAIVTLQTTQDDTIRTAVFRVLGTAFGGILGILTVVIGLFLPYYNDGLFVIVIPLMLLVDLYLCNFLKMQDFCSISCVVIIIVAARIAEDVSVGESLIFTLVRVRDTSIGVIVATVINVLPYYITRRFDAEKEDE